MKTKIYLGILSLVMGLTLGLASCSDDDYAINATPLLTDSSVVTGSARCDCHISHTARYRIGA